jgi:N utilization substance protein A
VGWDIEIMTHDELNEGIERAEGWFKAIPDVTDQQVETLIEEGFLSYNDLTFIEPAELGALVGLDEELADDIIQYAEEASEKAEEEGKGRADEGRHHPAASLKPSPAAAIAKLFTDNETPAATAPAATETKPTVESLFGPTEAAPAPETPLSAAQVFGDEPPPPTEPQP